MTDRRMTEILRGITVIIDTRENEYKHITDYFSSKGIPFISRKLEFGDYSFLSPAIPELNISKPISFENRLVIERKSGLTELSGNLAQYRERFENELQRAKEVGAKLILMVENGSYENILNHKYRTALNEKSYMASLFSFSHRYNIDVQFIPAKYAGMFIYGQFYYMLREELKELVS